MSDAWVARAACASLSVDESEAMFFGEDWSARQGGIRLCQTCPVRLDCLSLADSVEGSSNRSNIAGTWGGLTVGQRIQRRRSANA